MKRKGWILTVCLLSLSHFLNAQSGNLDPSFAQGGKLIRNIGLSGMDVVETLQQSDGKILFAGYAAFTASNYDFVLVRLLPDGSKDNSFGGDGIVTTDISGDFDQLIAATLLPSGKILVAGSGTTSVIVRYLSDGTIDPSFATAGKLFIQDAAGYTITDLSIQSDGKFVVSASMDFSPDYRVYRFLSTGLPDNTFAGIGLVQATISGYEAITTTAVAVQPDGKIIVAGTIFDMNGDYLITIRLTNSGILDNSYGLSQHPGMAITDAGPAWDEVKEVLIQQDGSVLLGGYGYDLGAAMQYTVIIRYTANGITDTGFDGDGILRIGHEINFFSLGKIKLNTSGQLMLTGIVRHSSGTYVVALARFNAAGQWDNSFGTKGILSMPSTGYSQLGVCLLLLSDGHMIVSGFEDTGLNFRAMVMNIQPGGLPEPTFDGDGTAVIPMGNASGDDRATAIIITAGDKPLVAGNYNKGLENSGFLYRFTADGGTDLGFGHNGRVNLHGSFSTIIYSMVQQPDGKILAAGTYYDLLEGANMLLCRFFSDGKIDSSFGTNGRVVQPLSNPGGFDQAYSIVLQSNGKIIVLASSQGFFQAQHYLMRFTANGVLDTTFGTGGKTELDFNIQDDPNAGFMQRIAVQADDKIVVVGAKEEFSGNNVAVRRYLSNGLIDMSFNAGNLVSTDFFGGDDIGYAVTIQPDGKIIVAAEIYQAPTGYAVGLVRYLSNGSRDLSFDGDGKVTAPAEASTFYIPSSLIVQSDQKILVVATKSFFSDSKLVVARWNAAGVPDASFGTNGISVISSYGDGKDFATGMALQSNGKILISGYGVSGNQEDFFIYRLENSLATGLRQIQPLQANISLSPNPVQNCLLVYAADISDGDYEILVHTSEGKQLFSKKVKVRGQVLNEWIDATKFPQGVLFVTIYSNKGRVSYKIVRSAD